MKKTFLLIILMLFSSLVLASQESQVKEGNASFAKNDWDGAVDHYLNALEQDGHGDILHYDLGTALYKKGEYDKSIEHFKKANPKKNPELSSKISYNLGNALFKKGQGLEEKNIDEAIKSVQDSIDQFHKAQEMSSKDADIQYNETQAKKELERLKKKKEQQQQQNQQNQKNQDQNKQDQKKKDSSNQNQQNNQKDSNKDKNQTEQNKNDQNKAQEQQQRNSKQQQEKSSQGDRKSSDQQKQQQQSAAEKEEKLQKEQAKEMLEEYEHGDAPKGLLNFSDKHRGDEHVDKDW